VESETKTWPVPPQQLLADAQQKAYLVHIYPMGPGIGALFHLGDAPTTLGRGEECQIRCSELTVSRRHAEVRHAPDGYWVTDLNSSNGTLVNDEVISKHRLADGDHLQIGSQVFRFLAGASVEVNFLEEIHRLAIIDGLTGVHNKAYLLDFIGRELARAARHGRPLSLLMFDVDNFKDLNERFGHWGGDCTLRELIRIIRVSMRKEELLARYGGDEFALVLLETGLSGANCTAERIRQVVANHPFHYEGNTYQVTISVGAASVGEGELLEPEEIIRRADAKLYEAKSRGRNRTA
jgi:diguanylate cyclase (GGDEF)-like protein